MLQVKRKRLAARKKPSERGLCAERRRRILGGMWEILLQAGMLVAVILLGYLLKRTGVLPEGAFGVVSKIVIYVTLPCVVIRNFARTEMDPAYLWMILLGFGSMALLASIGYLLNRRRGTDRQIFDMLNFTGFNIGCFALPYISGLTGVSAVVAVCMFDAGSALGAGGGLNALCRSMQEGSGFSFGAFWKRLCKTFLIVVYVVMIVLRLLAVPIPAVVVRFCDLCGSGNSFLAMLMLGLGVSLSIRADQWKWILKAMAVRYGVALSLAFCFYRFLPFSADVRLGAALAVLAPVASLAPPFTRERGGDYQLASSWNTLTILISLALMTAVMLLTA